MAALDQSGRLIVEVEGEGVVVFRVGAALRAVSTRCPHQDGPIHEGAVQGGEVVCPSHSYRYELASGRCTNVPGYELRRYRVRERAGRVQIAP